MLEVYQDLWVDNQDVVILTASFFDTNLSSNNFSGLYIAERAMIQTFGSFSNSLINHELNHKWVNSTNSFGFSNNNGHWGFIERTTSAFGQGCFTGAFTSLFLSLIHI